MSFKKQKTICATNSHEEAVENYPAMDPESLTKVKYKNYHQTISIKVINYLFESKCLPKKYDRYFSVCAACIRHAEVKVESESVTPRGTEKDHSSEEDHEKGKRID